MSTRARRDTATFEPYFWEAYNQIARPDRFDWYLISKWLPDLGPDGFTILKALRNLCYFNPREGTLRDTCQITVDELAEMTGMKRTSVYRVLDSNEALKHFVVKLPEALHIDGRTRRLPPRWRVCMDTPIHPNDMEAYDQLRGQREVNRAEAEQEKRKSQIEIYEKRKSHSGISGQCKSQNPERKSQNPERKSQSGISYKEESLPFGDSSKEETIPSGGAPPPAPSYNDPPKGEGEKTDASTDAGTNAGAAADPASLAQDIEYSLLQGIWNDALKTIAQSVNKPTFEAHIRALYLAEFNEETGEARVVCTSQFTREWLNTRHLATITEALSSALNRSCTVRLVVQNK